MTTTLKWQAKLAAVHAAEKQELERLSEVINRRFAADTLDGLARGSRLGDGPAVHDDDDWETAGVAAQSFFSPKDVSPAGRMAERLRTWTLCNIQSPFPSRVEREALAAETGATERQVNDWFKNVRKRSWNKMKDGCEPRTYMEIIFAYELEQLNIRSPNDLNFEQLAPSTGRGPCRK